MITGGPRQAVDPTKCHTSVALEIREIVTYGRRRGSAKRMSKFAFGAPLLVMCEVSGSTPLRYSGQLQFVVVSHSHALKLSSNDSKSEPKSGCPNELKNRNRRVYRNPYSQLLHSSLAS